MPRVSIVSPRLDSKPWGGRRLERYGLDLPPGERVGEALVTAGEAVITDGFAAGRTLQETIGDDPVAMLGPAAHDAVSGKEVFPLLAKLIDASENLSIQVHPDDTGARALDRLGKTEAWHVLAADPGALLYLGIRPGVSFDTFRAAAARLDGSSAPLMRTVAAQPGLTVLIPAGTVHALGAGVMVYEIQQPSDITWRLDDWGRVDDRGNPREVHLEAGFAGSRPELLPEPIAPVSLRPVLGERHLLAACRYFALERIALPAGGSAALGKPDSPSVITVLAGGASIAGQELLPGRSAVAWPAADPVTVSATAPLVALVATVPRLARDVVAPARRAGAPDHIIAALAGGTGDLVPVMTG